MTKFLSNKGVKSFSEYLGTQRKNATEKILPRIAEEQIKRFGLKDTPDEYIKKTISQSFNKA